MIILKKIAVFWRLHTTPRLNSEKDGLAYWREKILLSLIFLIVATALISYIPSVLLAIHVDLISIAVVDTIVYLALIILFVSKKLSVFFRSVLVLSLSYLLGVFLLVMVGPFGAGYLWLFLVPILVAILLDVKYVVISNLVNAFTLVIFGYLQYKNIVVSNFGSGFSPESWSIIVVNFIFLEFVATFSIVLIVRGLEKSLEKQIVISHDLEIQKEQLLEAKVGAENALEMKSEFLAQISHEIRTPINTILSFVSLIKHELSENQSESIKDSFGMIENGSKRVIRTIDMVLNMSELQTKTLEVNKQDFDLSTEVLTPLFNEFNQVAKNKGLSFKFENRLSGNSMIYADIYTVTQLIANLIDNSIKYTRTGEVKLHAEINEMGKVLVRVKDTGIGMTKEFQKELFQPFTQEETGYTRRFEGTGLGLSLVKSYSDINKSVLSVESEKNIGTTFSIEFKLVKS